MDESKSVDEIKQLVRSILSGLMSTITASNNSNDTSNSSQQQLYFSNVLNHIIGIITDLNANAKIIRDNFLYNERKDVDCNISISALTKAYKNIEIAFKSFNPAQDLLQIPSVANLKDSYTFICSYLKIVSLYKLV